MRRVELRSMSAQSRCMMNIAIAGRIVVILLAGVISEPHCHYRDLVVGPCKRGVHGWLQTGMDASVYSREPL